MSWGKDLITCFVILVEFSVQTGQDEAFEKYVVENAESSKRDEPGCLVFDVLHNEGSEYAFMLYEVYKDKAAFESHKASPHFAKFDQAVKSIVTDKRVVELRPLNPPHAAID
ncbi:putative quinol monooxygenase [Aquibaculum sediminis]|uniref:putative quinol monooxygenase n=1 Tax=Aquibaculum sediminis TaxID=3231907 RepID=UPI003456D0B4